FRKGDIPSGMSVVADGVDLQVSPKNVWQDGSLKFALLAGRVPLAANTPRLVALSRGMANTAPSLSLDDLRSTEMSAAIECGSFGLAAWAGADWNEPFHSWVA